MARYDRGFGGPRGGWRGQGGMGPGFPEPGYPPFEDPNRRGYGRTWRDRGVYGGAYEEYGGYPGGPSRGEYYGGRGGERPSHQRGYDGGWGRGFAREPFIPDEAYRRHPEYRQERRPRDWEAHQHGYGDGVLSDDAVRDAVHRRMSADAWLDPARIDVRVEDGVVTLTGEVDDYMEARYAWDDAWEADGVRGVINNLTVRTDQPREPHGDIVVQSAGGQGAPEPAGEQGF